MKELEYSDVTDLALVRAAQRVLRAGSFDLMSIEETAKQVMAGLNIMERRLEKRVNRYLEEA